MKAISTHQANKSMIPKLAAMIHGKAEQKAVDAFAEPRLDSLRNSGTRLGRTAQQQHACSQPPVDAHAHKLAMYVF